MSVLGEFLKEKTNELKENCERSSQQNKNINKKILILKRLIKDVDTNIYLKRIVLVIEKIESEIKKISEQNQGCKSDTQAEFCCKRLSDLKNEKNTLLKIIYGEEY